MLHLLKIDETFFFMIPYRHISLFRYQNYLNKKETRIFVI